MKSVKQAVFVPGTTNYQFGLAELTEIQITGAPEDTDWDRWTMLHDRELFRMYFFKKDSNDTFYQFAFDGTSYKFGYRSIPELTLTQIVETPNGLASDTQTFAGMYTPLYSPLYPSDEHGEYRLFFQQLELQPAQSDEPPQMRRWLNQYLYKPGSNNYRLDGSTAVQFEILDFPDDTDWNRWSMLYDDTSDTLVLPAYRIYAFKQGSNTELYHGTFDGSKYRFAYKQSIPIMTLTDTPENCDLDKNFAMLYDGEKYHLYMQTK
jgi:hypothetical protein